MVIKMRPKKREKVVHNETKPQFEQIQADHELFLQAFEKPTQIYRYLRSRNLVSPIFLHRTLTYMQCRNNRRRNTRYGFKVDNILEKVEARRKKDLNIESYKSEFMNLTFTGFFENIDAERTQNVDVELLLLKICHKKRKDVSSPLMEVSLGKVKVPYNPENATPSKAEAIAIGCDNFKHNNGHAVRSYTLLIRVTCESASKSNSLCNGIESEEPPSKRRRSLRPSTETDQSMNGHVTDEESQADGERVVYGAELVIYDKYKRCLLTEGDYDVALQELSTMVYRKQASWETVMDGKAVGCFEVFNKCPTIRFSLRWNKLPSHGVVDSPIPVTEALRTRNHFNNHHVAKELSFDRKHRDVSLTSPKKRRIFYQFMYNNNTRQQTEARDDLHCPWCSLNCLQLYSLLKHLRTSHPRFNFTYVEHPKGARIDVSINDCYDGSYVGNPQDLHSHIGFAFSRAGPVRRTPVTHIVVYRPKRSCPDLSEFLEPDDDNVVSRQFLQGHNRLYYHSATVIPLLPSEIEVDSEDEADPDWLKLKTINLIDEFTDVNEGEKEIMKMWNLHVMHFNFIADCEMTKTCQLFVDTYGERLVRDKLCRNFIVHLCNLYDFGLIKSDVVHRTSMHLFKLRDHLEGVGTSGSTAVNSKSSLATTSTSSSGSSLTINTRAFACINNVHSSQDSHNSRLSNGSSNNNTAVSIQGSHLHVAASSTT